MISLQDALLLELSMLIFASLQSLLKANLQSTYSNARHVSASIPVTILPAPTAATSHLKTSFTS